MDSPRSLARFALLALMLVGIVVWGRSVPTETTDDAAQLRLANGASSRDELVERFITALTANDGDTLAAIRVDEYEYVNLIMPGYVDPGQPIRLMPEKKAKRFWDQHNTRNIYKLQSMLKRHAGRQYTIKEINFPRVDKYAWYTVHRDPVILLNNEEGVTLRLEVGSIAERNGRFKFISYWVD